MCFHETAFVWRSGSGLRRPPFLAHLQPVTRNFPLRAIQCVLEFIYIRPSLLVLAALKQEQLEGFRLRFADSRNYILLASFGEVACLVSQTYIMQHTNSPQNIYQNMQINGVKAWVLLHRSTRQQRQPCHKILLFSQF